MIENPCSPSRSPSNPPPARAATGQRPVIISIAAGILIYRALRSFSDVWRAEHLPTWFKVDVFLHSAIFVAVGIGFIYLRRWAVVLYLAVIVTYHVRVAGMGFVPSLANFDSLVLPFVVMGAGVAYWRRLVWI